MTSDVRALQSILREAEVQGADLAALRENLRLTPADRFAALVEMNRFHGEVQERTLPLALRQALEARDIAEARARLAALGESL